MKRLVDYTEDVQRAREAAQDAVRSLSNACELQSDLFYLPTGDRFDGSYEHEAVNLLMQKAFELTEALRKGEIKPLT
jgi:hypothetical protein